MLLEAGGLECVGLRLDVGLGKEAAVDGLLAEAGPSEKGALSDTVDLRRGGKAGCERGEKNRCEQSAGCEERNVVGWGHGEAPVRK
jgi:hypothetical protein